MVTIVDADFWRHRRVLITGHTGFKGSWLSLWLSKCGADVHGFSLPAPAGPSAYKALRIDELVRGSVGDVRDLGALSSCVDTFEPEIVFHLAAQSLVGPSYSEPVETYATNVMGTVHVLEAVRRCPSVRAVVVVTSDKCYENQEWDWGYREDEPMGGRDPYSSSKGCAELVVSAYRSSFLNDAAGTGVSVGSARAGNVIGGGDWAPNRLVPDFVRAALGNVPLMVRSPHAIRPWQHVLEPLSAYMLLAQRLVNGTTEVQDGWNFGPLDTDARPVEWVVDRLAELWGDGATWSIDDDPFPHEAHFLKLDISKARNRLGWHPRWSLQHALELVVEWYKAEEGGSDMREVSLRQISHYESFLTEE